MSLPPHTIDPIPEQTVRIARAAFRRGNPFMRMRDEIGTLFTDEAFAPLFPSRGRPVVSPRRLALVCVMQYVENLSDRQAANAVRARIDGKYALSLVLDDPGFDASVLSEYRTRLVSGQTSKHTAIAITATTAMAIHHRRSQPRDRKSVV